MTVARDVVGDDPVGLLGGALGGGVGDDVVGLGGEADQQARAVGVRAERGEDVGVGGEGELRAGRRLS